MHNFISGVEVLNRQWKATLNIINITMILPLAMVELGHTQIQENPKIYPLLFGLSAAVLVYHFCKAYLAEYTRYFL